MVFVFGQPVRSANTLFVDSTNGNDSGAVIGRPDKPFKTLNQAISVSSANDTIILSVGTHTLSADVTIKNGQTLKGQGTNTIITGGQILGSDLIDATIRDLKIDATGVSNGIDIVDCTRVRIENIYIINATDDGAYIEFSGRLWIVNSTFEDNGRDGVNLNIGGIVGSAGDLDDNNPVILQGNYFVTNGRHGIYTFNMHDAVFVNNSIEDNTGNAIYVDSPAALTLLGNSMERNGGTTAAEVFIDLDAPSGSGASHTGGTITLSNNQIGGNTRGVYLEDNTTTETYKIIVDNNVFSSQRFPISFSDLTVRTQCRITRNNIRLDETSISETGINLASTANYDGSLNIVRENTIFGIGTNSSGSRVGVSVGYAQGILVSDNTVDNVDTGYRMAQANSNMICLRNRAYNTTNFSAFDSSAAIGSSTLQDNIGHVNENTGTATITTGNTTIAVNHGLDDTPLLQEIQVTPSNNMGSATKFWITNVTSTQFTINVDVNPAGDATFVWFVRTS